MTPAPHDPAARPMRAPAPTLGQLLPRALAVAVVAALSGGALAALGTLVWAAMSPERQERLSAAAVLSRCGFWSALLFFLFYGATLLFRHRVLQDRAFTVAGLAATFFGLAMLIVFFCQLGREVALYFEVTPGLIERQNRELERNVAQAKRILDDEMAQVDAEMKAALDAAADEKDRQEVRDLFEKEIIPNKRQDLETTAREAKRAAELGVRKDTSAPALFWHFVTSGPSSQPQDTGIWPALLGSLWVAGITLLFAVPVGVGAALYLEEYRSNNWVGKVIQVNINNLAGVPSVVYGILGAFVFVTLFQNVEHNQAASAQRLADDPDAALGLLDRFLHWLPAVAARNVLGGGLTLGLLTLPVVIVAAQEAIRAVPPSIRQGAYALGATQWQVIWRQVLPMASPGILTGTILALSRAIGEAAPLILFGALLFVNQRPGPFTRFTILPMQIFGWSDRPAVHIEGYERQVEIWQANAALASLILVGVLLVLNGGAIYLRNRYQKDVGA